eukprot:364664-Chlamydomonas_euryale.AAC.20
MLPPPSNKVAHGSRPADRVLPASRGCWLTVSCLPAKAASCRRRCRLGSRLHCRRPLSAALILSSASLATPFLPPPSQVQQPTSGTTAAVAAAASHAGVPTQSEETRCGLGSVDGHGYGRLRGGCSGACRLADHGRRRRSGRPGIGVGAPPAGGVAARGSHPCVHARPARMHGTCDSATATDAATCPPAHR